MVEEEGQMFRFPEMVIGCTVKMDVTALAVAVQPFPSVTVTVNVPADPTLTEREVKTGVVDQLYALYPRFAVKVAESPGQNLKLVEEIAGVGEMKR